jgi:CheY-like chemotaxis protein
MARILVVEDNPQNLKLTTVILESEGHTVLPAVDALEAERTLADGNPDLIVLDMALPGKDGYAFARELRANLATAPVPILAVSAFAMPGDADRARAAGCDDYLTKPIRRALLLERVNSMLDRAGEPLATGRPRPAPAGPPSRRDESVSEPSAAGGPA